MLNFHIEAHPVVAKLVFNCLRAGSYQAHLAKQSLSESSGSVSVVGSAEVLNLLKETAFVLGKPLHVSYWPTELHVDEALDKNLVTSQTIGG